MRPEAVRWRMADFNPRSSCEERLRHAVRLQGKMDISIHAPHARSDPHFLPCLHQALQISIHAPHARSDFRLQLIETVVVEISIHAPHARSDPHASRWMASSRISIHAPHARSDSIWSLRLWNTRYFNPRSSCEERHGDSSGTPYMTSGFQSTLLMRGATSTSRQHTGQG